MNFVLSITSFIISIIPFLLPILVPIVIGIIYNKINRNNQRFFSTLMFFSCCLLTIFGFLIFLFYRAQVENPRIFFISNGEKLYKAVVAVLGLFFGFYGDLDQFLEFSEYPILTEHKTLVVFLLILAFILTISIILNVFLKIFKKIQYHLWILNKVCIFSSLSEETLITARSLLKEYPKTKIIIFNSEDNSSTNNLKNEAYSLNALIFDYDLTQFNLGRRLNSTYIVLNKRDNLDNINDFVTLAQENAFKKCTGKNTDIYLFNTSEDNQVFLNEFRKRENIKKNLENCFVKYVDVYQNDIYHLFIDNPIYSTKSKEQVNLLIIGEGEFACKLLRTAFWMGVLNNKTLNIIVGTTGSFTSYKKFLKENYPELKSQNDISITFISNVCLDEVKYRNPNYVIVATDDESFNINFSLNILRDVLKDPDDNLNIRIFPWVPTFYLNCDEIDKTDNSQCNSFFELKNNKEPNVKYEYKAFGNLSETYSYQNIFAPKFDNIGFAVYLMYRFKKLKETYSKDWVNKIKISIIKFYMQAFKNPFVIIHHRSYYKIYSLISKQFLDLNNIDNSIDIDTIKYPSSKKVFFKVRFDYWRDLINEKILKRIKSKLGKSINSTKSDVNQVSKYLFIEDGTPIYEKLANFEKNYYENEYDRRSSIASGIHLKIILDHLANQYGNEDSTNSGKKFETKLAKKEHIRWMHYLFAQGFSRFNINDITKENINNIKNFNEIVPPIGSDRVNSLGKTHICLVDWKNLTKVAKKYGKKKSYFQDNDRHVVKLRKLYEPRYCYKNSIGDLFELTDTKAKRILK